MAMQPEALPEPKAPKTRAQEAACDSHEYERAVKQGAHYIEAGVYALADVEAQDWMGDVTDAQFAADIQQFVDETDEPVRETETQAESDATITDPDNVDWGALWDEFGCPHDDYMSRTQLATAVSVSEEIAIGLETPQEPGDGHAPAGLVAKWATADPDAPASTDVLRGYALPREVRRDE